MEDQRNCVRLVNAEVVSEMACNSVNVLCNSRRDVKEERLNQPETAT